MNGNLINKMSVKLSNISIISISILKIILKFFAIIFNLFPLRKCSIKELS